MISEILGKGKEAAIPGRVLAQRLGVDVRAITRMIETERRKGTPICAIANGNPKGYFIAKTQEELKDYCEMLAHRARQLFVTRQALVKLYGKMESEKGERDFLALAEELERDRKEWLKLIEAETGGELQRETDETAPA